MEEPQPDNKQMLDVDGNDEAEGVNEDFVVDDDEPIAHRTRAADYEPIAARTRSGTAEMASFADYKVGTNLQEWLQETAFVTSTMSDPIEPQSFQKGWWHEDLVEREKWRDAIRLEFHKIDQMNVWRKVSQMQRPGNRRLVGCKWVFKIKRNGVYRARLVAQGFSQIPGVNFTESYSPVVNDVTF